MLLAMLIGCNDDPIDNNVDFNYNLYPIEVGSYWEYKLDSITYDNKGALVQEKSGYLRELVVEQSINSLNNDTIYVVEMSRKKNFSDSWISDKLIRIEKTSTSLNRVEDNLLFIQLLFPASLESSWDGTQFVEEDIIEIVEGESIDTYINWSYQILDTEASIDTNGETLSNLIKVQEADNENGVNKRLSTAYYQEGVGMVYRYREILHTQCLNNMPPCAFEDAWMDKAEKGYIVEQYLINNG